MMNNDTYITAVLNSLSLPVTKERVNFLRSWAARENTTAKNNPFATTWDMEPGRTDRYIGGYYFNYNNNFPVKNYSTFDLGVRAFVNTIKQSNFSHIYNGLKSGLSFEQWYDYIVNNEFRTYGGAGYGELLATIYNQYKNLPINNTSFAGGLLFLLLLAGSFLKNKLHV